MKIILIFLTFLIASCASQPPKISQTPSGWPQIKIEKTNVDDVKSSIIGKASVKGWILEQESQNSLFFTRMLEYGTTNSILTQMAIGNSHSTQPKYELRYILNKERNNVNIIVNVHVSTQMAFGQVNRVSLINNNEWFNAAQTQLIEFKDNIENNKKY